MSSKIKRASSLSSSVISRHPIFSQFSQLSQQLDERKPYIYFVIPPGKTSEECANQNLGEMFLAAEAHSLNVMWIEDEACKEQELQEDGNVFIFDPFGTSGFHYCMGKLSSSYRVEILGPAVLRQVFTDPQESTFETKECPIYTLAMRNMVVCLSGFKDKGTKEELEKLVRWMNGTLTSSLTKAVTHVVTASAFTPKCIEANKQQIPVMIEEWVRQVWIDNQDCPVDAKDRRYVKFACPVFYKVNICLSQITAVKKNTLKSGIEQQGGKCSSELVKKETDILVVPNASGDKFKFAQKWGVTCVTPAWVENSIDKKHLLPPADYKVTPNGQEFSAPPAKGPLITSTPAHSIMAEWSMTRCSDIFDENRMVVEATKANFTGVTEIQDETMVQLRAIAATGTYLEGCMVYLVEHEKCDELKRELNKSGATRLNELREGVTHVIVKGQRIPKAIQEKINNLDSRPYIITADWIIQSAKNGSPADEEMFKFEQVSALCPETINEHPNFNTSSHVGRVSVTALENHPQEPQDSPATTNVTKQTSRSNPKMTATETTTRSKSVTVTSNTSAESNTSTRTGTTDGEETDSDPTQEENTTSENQNPDEAESSGLFFGRTFKVAIPDKEERKYVEDIITENDGELVSNDADVTIFPSVCNSADKDRAGQSYTKFWLFECLEFNTLDVEGVYYHTPLRAFKKMNELFVGVVVAVSQYQSNERSYIIDVIREMGGRFQDVFARKDSTDGKNSRSTHLICKNMDTEKAKAAKRWNVPVVVADWAVDSFKERRRLSEDRYDPTLCNTTDERTIFMPTPQRRKTISANANQNNVSVRSIYPPSTQKGVPNTLFSKNKRDASADRANPNEKPRTPPLEPQPSTSKSAKPRPSNEEFREPSVPKKASAAVVTPSTSSKPAEQPANVNVQGSPFPSQEEIDEKMAEFKAMFPYSDDSWNQKLEDMKEQGLDWNEASPFTSFEERRLLDPNPDSPLLLGLPRHESRSLKEQFEIALNRTPKNQKHPVKTPPSTPLTEVIRRLNAMLEVNGKQQGSPIASPRITSTPKEDLRRRTLNRLSQGHTNAPFNQNEPEDGLAASGIIEGIKKLGTKRPSDGSPEEEEPKSSKRARQSSDEDIDMEEMAPKKSTSPNENIVPKQTESNRHDNEKPSTSRKPNRMQFLTNLIAAENQINSTSDANGTSPIKRRSGDNLVHCEEVHEEIERPHLSWVENDEDQNEKRSASTVKKVASKPKIAIERQPDIVEPEPVPVLETRKRSSRLKKASSVVNEETGGGRVTRQTRNRSRSKSRREDSAPLGHQPINISEGKKPRKKKSVTFPVVLPDNPVFGVSSLDQQEKSSLVKIIESLGGSISKSPNFDIDCDAVITRKLLRSEKILGCIASGKFLLTPDYLNKSKEAGNFIPIEEEFLWDENNLRDSKEREIARAYTGWLKLQMRDKSRRPMVGMKFYIFNQPLDRVRAFERLISAGGGDVVSDLNEATCIIKDDKTEMLVPEGIQTESPLYLNTLILTVPQYSA